MNNPRRKDIAKAIELLEQAQSIIEVAYDEEQCCLDNMPENLQSSERYETMENACECLSESINFIDDAINTCNDAIE